MSPNPSTAIPTPYEDLLREVMADGVHTSDRTGTGTRSVFGRQIRYDLSQGFPLLTTKRVHFRSVALELLWFLRGSSNVRWLQERGVSIWDEWADADGELFRTLSVLRSALILITSPPPHPSRRPYVRHKRCHTLLVAE